MKSIVLAAALLSSGLAPFPSRAIRGGPPSCVEVAAHPGQYIGTTVTLLAIKYLVSSTTVDGKAVILQIYGCSDSLGSADAYQHLFALAPRDAINDADAGNRVAQRVTGTVHAALEVPMPSGRFQVKVVMPYLTGVTIHAP